MIEIFKTNVKHRVHAKMLIDQIHQACDEYTANFDLEDCDHILRVKSNQGPVVAAFLVDLLGRFGFYAEVLPDIQPVASTCT